MSSLILSTLPNGSGIVSNQTITASNSGSITFTVSQGSVPLGNAYLTVNNSGTLSNSLPIFLTANSLFPTKIVLLGGSGNKSGASNDNAGAYISGEQTLALVQGGNGNPLYTVNGCVYNSSSGTIIKTASFASNLKGNYVNIISGASGTLENKRYYIQASHSDWLLIGQGYTENSNINVIVGGALKTYEKALSSGIVINGDTLYSTYGSESYVTAEGNTITLSSSSSGGRPTIGGGLINYV